MEEKIIHYDDPKRKKSYVKPGQPGTSMPKPHIHGAKVMLFIWWDQEGMSTMVVHQKVADFLQLIFKD